MFYAILGIIVVVALFLIFRDDHDTSYNREEKRSHNAPKTETKATQPQGQRQAIQPSQHPTEAPKAEPEVEQPKAGQTAGTSLKDRLMREVEARISGAGDATKEPIDIFQIAMEVAKEKVETAMKEAGKKPYWTSSTDVDEQEQPEADEPDDEDWEDEEEMDLSFLDNLDYYEDLEENSETFDITGLRYHCTVHDCGKIVGYVKPEPSNLHDVRAKAVIRSDGKLLGYIPRTQLDWYEDFNEQNVVCPFVGEIELDPSSARLVAEIKVIIPTSQ